MSEHNPWKTVSSRIAYRNAWISVREDEVIRPDGAPGIYSVVETRTAVGVVAVDQSGNLYMVGQWRYPVGEYSWEIVEGGGEAGEDPLLTAKRELQEEAGLEAEHWLQLGPEVHLTNCHSSELAYFFLATGLREVDASPDGTELLQVKRVPFAEALRAVAAGETKDAMSIIALARAAEHLSNLPRANAGR